MKKRGISPVIATVLLISMVIVVGLIIFLWLRQWGGETITKFGDKNAELVCQDIKISASHSSGKISVINTGNIPVFQMKVSIDDHGDQTTKNLHDYPGWPDKGLNPGMAATIDLGASTIGSAEEIVLIPILLGNSGEVQKTYACDEEQNGIVVFT